MTGKGAKGTFAKEIVGSGKELKTLTIKNVSEKVEETTENEDLAYLSFDENGNIKLDF